MATIADLGGTKPAPYTDGSSLAPVILGDSEMGEERFLYWEFFENGFEQAVRWGRWKAVRHAPGDPLELYDLNKEVSEETNVAGEHPEVVATIESHLKTARTESNEWPLRLVRTPKARENR